MEHRGSPVGISKRADGVVARAGEEAVGEVWSLVVLPPDYPGRQRVGGEGVEDFSVVLAERGEAVGT